MQSAIKANQAITKNLLKLSFSVEFQQVFL